jgi:hypothetical protein
VTVNVTESEHQEAVIDLAKMLRWRVYHTFDSRHSEPGFPDLVLVRGPRIVFSELKRDTGKITAHQASWLAGLMAAGGEVYVWRPRDWDQIVETLTRPDRPPLQEAIAA